MTGWDIGGPSTPLVKYFDQLADKQRKILIPGAGNAYEAEYLWAQGFSNVHVLDIAPQRHPADEHQQDGQPEPIEQEGHSREQQTDRGNQQHDVADRWHVQVIR